VASVLNDIGYTASQIEGVLSDVFSETTSAIESELSSLGFNSATIDAIGGAFTSFGDAVAGGLTSAGNAIVSFFKGW
jgi:Flp pilus assembly pilin Flp